MYKKNRAFNLSVFQLSQRNVKHLFPGLRLDICMNCDVTVNISQQGQVDAIGKTRTNS